MLVVGKYPVFGAVPPAQQAPIEAIRSPEITDRVLRVGPFMMNPEGDVLEFSLASFTARYPGEYQDFLRQLIRVSNEICKSVSWRTPDEAYAYGCHDKYKGIGPSDQKHGISKALLDGKRPLYRVDNPVHPGEEWGLYLELIGDGDAYGVFALRRIKLTFKRVPQDWLDAVWNFLVKLVAVIVSLVKDILVGLLKGLCQQAQLAGQQLSDVAEGKAQLTGDMKTKFNSYGVPTDVLMKLSGGGLTSTMLRSVATSLAGSLCESLTEGQYPPGSFAVFTGTEYRIFIPAT